MIFVESPVLPTKVVDFEVDQRAVEAARADGDRPGAQRHVVRDAVLVAEADLTERAPHPGPRLVGVGAATVRVGVDPDLEAVLDTGRLVLGLAVDLEPVIRPEVEARVLVARVLAVADGAADRVEPSHSPPIVRSNGEAVVTVPADAGLTPAIMPAPSRAVVPSSTFFNAIALFSCKPPRRG